MKDAVKPVHILLVEDNLGDVLLTKEAFRGFKIKNEIDVASDGEQAMNMLNRVGEYSDYRRPDLILLDLNMPKKDGRETLSEIKNHPELKSIPVIIMTSSKAEVDVVKTYDLHANSYIVKPVDLEQFSKIVSSIEEFWFTVVILPNSS